MTGVPIDEAAIDFALNEIDISSPREELREGVSAYLGAVGATVEERTRCLGLGIERERRTVFPWKPLTDTQKFETEEAMRFGSRSYTDEQQAVIDQAVAERKPLSAPPLTDTEEER